MVVQQFLRWHVARQRAVLATRAVIISLCYCGGWLLLWCVVDRLLALSSMVRWGLIATTAVGLVGGFTAGLWRLLRSGDAVSAAIDIESQSTVFDQRLVTVASPQTGGPLLDHLVDQVQKIIAAGQARSRVSLKPLVSPALLLLAILLLWIQLWRLPAMEMPMHLWRICHPRTSSISKMNSTSTLASSGNVFTPTAARTCRPGSPKISSSSSLAPLATCGC